MKLIRKETEIIDEFVITDGKFIQIMFINFVQFWSRAYEVLLQLQKSKISAANLPWTVSTQ
jgi:hypothetical protein